MRLFLTALLALFLMSATALAEDGAEAAEPAWVPQPGQLVHIEIPSKDLQESAKFYGDLFGWESKPAGSAGDYLIWTDGGQSIGGFTADATPADGGVILYIFVVSIHDAYAAIDAAGGSSSGTEISVGDGEGYIGMFHDPSGNLIGLYSMQPSMQESAAASEAPTAQN